MKNMGICYSLLLIAFLLSTASAQPGTSAVNMNMNTTALKDLVVESERNLESLDSYRFTLTQDQRIETINLTDGNSTYRLFTIGSGAFNFTGKAMRIVTAALYYQVGQEENANATTTEVYLLNDTLYNSVGGKWTATTLPSTVGIWNKQTELNQSASLTNASDVRLLGTVVIDGEGFYVVEVIPRSGEYASLINSLLGPRFSISSVNLSAFFNNTQLRYVLWISMNNHTPVAEYIQTNTTITPEMLGISSQGNIVVHLEATTTLMLSGFNKSAIIVLPEQAKSAVMLPLNATQRSAQVSPLNNTSISPSGMDPSPGASPQDPVFINGSSLSVEAQQQLWLAGAYAFLNGGYYYYNRPLYSYPNMPYYSGPFYPYNIPYYAPYPMNYAPYTTQYTTPYAVQSTAPYTPAAPGYTAPAQGYAVLGQGYTAPASGYTIMTASNSSLGTYLTDGRGMTLYHLLSDQGSYTSKCTDATCTGIWPPFYAASISAPVNLNPADFTMITVNGYKQYHQTTYKGWPLYYFYKDTVPGNVYGQGISDSYGVWSVVNPEVPSTFPTNFPYQTGGAAAAQASAQYQYTAQQPSTVTIPPSPPVYTTPGLYPTVPTPAPVTTTISGDVPVTIRYPGPGTFDVYLDGNYVGTGTGGSFSFNAPAGTHDVRVWDGNFDYEQSVQFVSGVSKIINVEAV
jgi:predicted lipoprotein with Yx(FWY)xxD motif